MKAAVYYRNADVRVEERPIPQIGRGELLVKVEACGLCGGETMEWYLAPRAPKILGHEPAGVVVEIGEGVTDFAVGDRVYVHHHVPCNACRDCQRGSQTVCTHYGTTRIDPGGFAEYFRVPAENAALDTLKLPDTVSFEEAALIEPVACCLRGLRQIRVVPGDTIAIVGVGLMGMAFVQLATLYPFAKIVALDFSDWRLEQARRFGATHTINARTENAAEALLALNGGRLADAVVSTAPSGQAWSAALELCGKGSTFHVAAPPHPDERIEINPNKLYFDEITVNSAYSSTNAETTAVLELIASGRFDAKGMITHRFGLDGAVTAIAMLLEAGESLKSVIVPALTPKA